MKRSLLAFVALGVILALAACNTETPVQGDLVQHNWPIINGDPPNAPMHDAVVSLHQRVGSTVYADIFCSGTLIAPDVVLTAAHCLDVGRSKPKAMSPDALAIYVGDNPPEDPSPEVHAVIETYIHPQYNSRSITNDIGLVRLADSVGSVTPVPALPASLGFTAADEGHLALNFCGFGMDEYGHYNAKLQFDGVLDHIQSSTQIYYYQYDGGPCSGDSGGPAFVTRGGKAYMGGMTSYGDYYCTQYGVSTRADAFEALIADFVGVSPPPPDCSADGYCNPDCETGADPDCAPPPPDCSADGYCNPDCETGADPDCAPPPPDCSADDYCNPDCDAGADPDCSSTYCGDGYCDGRALGEDCDTCPVDCPEITKRGRRLACCGDGKCDRRESASQCPVDCL
ncbi:MAG: trypsin-like serine protease [Deltaproteobacteria bacterium]|nr:trypsin-like serine protease [Deltaproteobacteria bacterium]